MFFNCSFHIGTIPNKWKLANKAPILIQGSKAIPSNYHPISLTSVLGKMVDTLKRDRHPTWLSKLLQLPKKQLNFLSKVFSECDNNKALDAIYLDFQKAFDKVPHKCLKNTQNSRRQRDQQETACRHEQKVIKLVRCHK